MCSVIRIKPSSNSGLANTTVTPPQYPDCPYRGHRQHSRHPNRMKEEGTQVWGWGEEKTRALLFFEQMLYTLIYFPVKVKTVKWLLSYIFIFFSKKWIITFVRSVDALIYPLYPFSLYIHLFHCERATSWPHLFGFKKKKKWKSWFKSCQVRLSKIKHDTAEHQLQRCADMWAPTEAQVRFPALLSMRC